MRSQQAIIVALALSLSLATMGVKAEETKAAPSKSFVFPWRSTLKHGTKDSLNLPDEFHYRKLIAAGAKGRSMLADEDYEDCGNLYYGECPAFTNEAEGKWVHFMGENYCCGADASECCPTDGGAVAGLVIGIVVFLAGSITACAWCCKCCCFKPPPAPTVVMATVPTGQVPQVQVPMGQVQMQPQTQQKV